MKHTRTSFKKCAAEKYRRWLIVLSSLLISLNIGAQSDLSLSVSIPQGSGLAFVDYRIYTISNDTLYTIKRYTRLKYATEKDSIDMDYHTDTLSFRLISAERQDELRKLVAETDSLGEHVLPNGCFYMGWPRFYIHAAIDNRKMDGFVACCYREHIYRLIDFLNACHTEHPILTYDKAELIRQEEEYRTDAVARPK